MRCRTFYVSLTGWTDPPPMQSVLVSYLRFVGFSAAALALACCAKLAPTDGALLGLPEPRFGEPPSGQMTAAATPVSDAERLALLEAQIDTLGSEIAHLRKALDLMGPLPEQADMFIPVDRSEITGEAPIVSDPEGEAAARLARLYSPPPSLNRASTLFYEAELGVFGSNAAAEAGWKRLAAGNAMAGLQPKYAAVGNETRLSAGPLASEAAVAALCIELSSLAGQCRVAAPVRAY
jgi:hypothetical protein